VGSRVAEEGAHQHGDHEQLAVGELAEQHAVSERHSHPGHAEDGPGDRARGALRDPAAHGEGRRHGGHEHQEDGRRAVEEGRRRKHGHRQRPDHARPCRDLEQLVGLPNGSRADEAHRDGEEDAALYDQGHGRARDRQRHRHPGAEVAERAIVGSFLFRDGSFSASRSRVVGSHRHRSVYLGPRDPVIEAEAGTGVTNP
jgi:hypothetical protein